MSTFRTPRQLLNERAYNAVRLAIRSGRLTRDPCEWCGTQDTKAVHPSLHRADWLTVLWLCRKCTKRWHRNFTQAVPLVDMRGNPVENWNDDLWRIRMRKPVFSTPFDNNTQTLIRYVRRLLRNRKLFAAAHCYART